MCKLSEIRSKMRQNTYASDKDVLNRLRANQNVSQPQREEAVALATNWVEAIRESGNLGLMDVFMAEYGLSTDEGIALMCLAEALLRVPDSETMNALIEDKIAPSDWGVHLGKSSSSLVNASTWALMLTGKVLDDERPMAGVMHGAIKRMGEPVIRQAVRRAMRELGAQFVLGQDMKEALKNGKSARNRGFTYSYDMLGEAAMTADDAQGFYESYASAIESIAPNCRSDDIRNNPGISIKLSALYERYEFSQADRVMEILVPRVLKLAKMARDAGMGLNIDAEEANRLDLSMDVIEAVVRNPSLDGWDGFGIVVQAYGKRASYVIDWFYELAQDLDRKFMLRLVKGAYWDTEIKLAQVENLKGFPVFETKPATDVAYIENAAKLLEMTDRIYPQFATHNAHSVAMVKILANGRDNYEFQRLHGMGDGLYDQVMKDKKIRCRIYAPVGIHQDLLAYLVRRLLENGANSSFVNQILDDNVPASEVASDPYIQLEKGSNFAIQAPSNLFGKRQNSQGWDLTDPMDIADIERARAPFMNATWNLTSQISGKLPKGVIVDVINPANDEKIGSIAHLNSAQTDSVIANAKPWNADVKTRAKVLRKAADLYEKNFGEIFALLTREAGKAPLDVIAELREAVDFLRFYAGEAEKNANEPAGIFACISPWNFPLAIFTGQISAALAMGNGVIAKPAENSSLIAVRAVNWLHEAGVPKSALQLVCGLGSEVGAALSKNPKIDGICFTGSTATAQNINRSMAENLDPSAPLIAETGGLNAMIVDSTALPEQAVRDIVNSAFQSAGQRCSALRVLYLQEDVADRVLKMLYGAMDALRIGDPWDIRNDIGPVIDANAKNMILDHVKIAAKEGRVLKALNVPKTGHFVAPTVISLGSINELKREIFGPILHVVRYKASELDKIINDINSKGYGLTFGIHSRIDDRVEKVSSKIKAGNIYVNRNQIGAIVESQPFGGEGLSGTGPKAGGTLYLSRFGKQIKGEGSVSEPTRNALEHLVATASFSREPLEQIQCAGPTGESNQWSKYPRGVLLCAGPGREAVQSQVEIAQSQGCAAIEADGVDPNKIEMLQGFHGLVYWGEGRAYRKALTARDGAILPLITARDFASWCWVERHICVDTTAAGGNAKLLAGE